jgi:hypothetical protein
MKENFVIKEGKENSYYFLLLCLCGVLIFSHQGGASIYLVPLMLLLIIAVASVMFMRFRWMLSFAVFLDVNKEELILNHSLFFRKKKIAFKDIKRVDTENGNIILFGSTPLSKMERLVAKTSNDYTIRFGTIAVSERRRLLDLLSALLNNKNRD